MNICIVTDRLNQLWSSNIVSNVATGWVHLLCDEEIDTHILFTDVSIPVSKHEECKLKIEEFYSCSFSMLDLDNVQHINPVEMRRDVAVVHFFSNFGIKFDIILFIEEHSSAYYSCLCKKIYSCFDATRFGIVRTAPELWRRRVNRYPLMYDWEMKSSTFEQCAAANADFVLCPSDYMLQWLYAQGEKFVSLPSLPITEPPLQYRQRNVFPTETITDIYVHVAQEDTEGVLRLLQAFAIMPRALLRGKRLVLYSRFGENKTAILEGIQALSLGMDLPFCAIECEVAWNEWSLRDHVKHNSALYVLPEREDYWVAFPEILQANAPLLVTDVGGRSEFIHPDDRVSYCVPCRPADMADALTRMLMAPFLTSPRIAPLAISASERALCLLHAQVDKAIVPSPPEPRSDILVSVIIPTYNRPRLLLRAVDSVLAQTHQFIEVIIVNDGSTDVRMPSVLATLEQNERINVVTQTNSYAATARNTGIAIAKGEFIVFLDDDNALEPHCIECALYAIQRSCADVITFSGKHVSLEDIEKNTCSRQNGSIWLAFGYGMKAAAPYFKHTNIYGDTCCMVRKLCFEEHKFVQDRGIAVEDYEWFLTNHYSGRCILPLMDYQFLYTISLDSISQVTNAVKNKRIITRVLHAQGEHLLAVLSEMVHFRGQEFKKVVAQSIDFHITVPTQGIPTSFWGKQCSRLVNHYRYYLARKQKKVLAASVYMDAKWYLEQNPDVRTAGIDPVLHYALHGWREGRDPGPNFSTQSYFSERNDVYLAKINPLWHYEYYGKRECQRGEPHGVCTYKDKS